MMLADYFRVVFLRVGQVAKLPAEVCRDEHKRTATGQAGGGKGDNEFIHNSKD